MKNQMISVIVIKEGVVHENILVESSAKAKRLFLKKCREYVFDFSEYKKPEIEMILDDGYVKFGLDNSVCINWPEVKQKPDKPKLFINVEGGIIQEILANRSCEIVLCDYDTDGDEAVITDYPPEVNEKRIEELFAQAKGVIG